MGTVKTDMRQGKLSMSLKFPERYRNVGKVEFINNKVRPYTAIQKVFDLTPVFNTQTFKVMKSGSERQTKDYELGNYAGINMKLVYKTETPYLGTGYVLQKLSNLHYNPLNMVHFSGVDTLGLTPTGLPSVRYHESKVMVFPQSSSTKEVEFVFKFGFATKESGQPIVYHMMEPSRVKLINIVSLPIGEIRGHPRRQ